ncbi:MAG: DUF6702 family protein [Planctomycetota bacterium]
MGVRPVAAAAAARTAEALLALSILISAPAAAEYAAAGLSVTEAESAEVHPYHVAFAEATLTEDGTAIEVALRLWPDDLEKALRRFTGDSELNIETTPGVDEAIASYLGERFVLRAASSGGSSVPVAEDAPPVRFIGKEIGAKHAWVYFVADVPPNEGEVDIACSVAFEVERDQENTVELRLGDRRVTAVSNARDPWTRVRLDRSADTIETLAATLRARLRPLPLAANAQAGARVIAIEVRDVDLELPIAAELAGSIARLSKTLVLTTPDRFSVVRRALAETEAEVRTVSEDLAPTVAAAAGHLGERGASVVLICPSFGDNAPVNRAARTLATLDPPRSARAVVTRTDAPIGGVARSVVDLRGLPLTTVSRWMDVAGLRGPQAPDWVLLDHRPE